MTDLLKNKEVKALINLLYESDDEIYNQVKNKIFSYGIDVVPALENAWESTFDDLIQYRIENIIHKIQFDDLCIELKNWAQFKSKDILSAYILVTKYQYPDIEKDKIKTEIEKIKHDVWLELSDNLTPLEKIKVLNHIFYEIYKFRGNISNLYTPQNFYLNNLLEIKKGNSLSLGILYLIIAKNLNMPVYGINLPGHFILAYANELRQEKISFIDKNEMLFYINPLRKGYIFQKKQIDIFVKQMNIEPKKSFYYPCDNTDIIKRFLLDLSYSYEKSGELNKEKEIKILINALQDK
jgi:regulator of sirC expression with transglutaminase-like and TPR domain